MRGWVGFGTTFSSGISRTAVGVRAESRLMMPGCASVSCWKMRLPAERNDLLRAAGGLLVSTDDLLREIVEALRGLRAWVIRRDRDAGGRCLAHLHRLADDRVEHLVVAELAQRIEHVPREDRAAVVEGRQQSEHLQLRVEPTL